MIRESFTIALALCAAVLVVGMEAGARGDSSTAEGKKIIMWAGIGGSGGQPSPPEWASIGVGRSDSLPVDGMIYNISNNGGYLPDRWLGDTGPISYDSIKSDVDLVRSFKLKRLKHNFARVDTGFINCDWYDDAAWDKMAAKVKVASRAAKEAGAVGFMLDSEQYVHQPFNYTLQSHRMDKTFDEYRAQVRKRGRQFMEALTSRMPRAKIYMTFSTSAVLVFGGGAPPSVSTMGLLPAFLDGMMDGGPKAEFIDGYEMSYHYRTYAQFKEAREVIKKAASLSFDPMRYSKRIKVSYGLWLRKIGATECVLDTTDYTKNTFTPEELKHALHYALRLSDGYVWLYAFPWFTMPKEYLDAVKEARLPQPLDFKPVIRPDEQKPAAYILSAKGRADCADDVVFAAFKNAGYKEIYDFPKQWRFRIDPRDMGVKEKWHTTYNSADWIDIEIGDWWEPQLNSTYLGYAWYRFELDAPGDWQGKKLLLAFGAVDEEAWVWVNGESIGEHAIGSDGWNAAFEFDVTGKLLPGRKNTVCVRVYNSAGVGGIWKSVKIFTR